MNQENNVYLDRLKSLKVKKIFFSKMKFRNFIH
jgi:hypothetical protein